MESVCTYIHACLHTHTSAAFISMSSVIYVYAFTYRYRKLRNVYSALERVLSYLRAVPLMDVCGHVTTCNAGCNFKVLIYLELIYLEGSYILIYGYF
jgi:hypothetical protein